jgi:hypothetical protein
VLQPEPLEGGPDAVRQRGCSLLRHGGHGILLKCTSVDDAVSIRLRRRLFQTVDKKLFDRKCAPCVDLTQSVDPAITGELPEERRAAQRQSPVEPDGQARHSRE